MTGSAERFDAAPALAHLKDFQRATAEHVFSRLYEDPDTTRRFLVADEVGLGKTLVARGVVAKAIEHLQDVVERVDVVYVCSNALIAKQNLQRLRVGEQEHFELAERITMLPATAHRLAENKINLISFTPGTSFELKAGSGKAQERALLRLLLAEVWGHDCFGSRGSLRVFQGGVHSLDKFKAVYDEVARQHRYTLDRGLLESLAATLESRGDRAAAAGKPGPWERFEELCQVFGHARPKTGWSRQERSLRNSFIGELRDLLARACLDALEPDLIIMDEFQRFKHLLADPDSPHFSAAAELAQQLFEHEDTDSGSLARTLLLSATPYKMLTTQADEDEDHHDDFVETVRFLLRHDETVVQRLRTDLRGLRRGLQQLGRDGGSAAMISRDRVQATLRRVMVRTERLTATPDRSGMLNERVCEGLQLGDADVGRFVASARLARDLDVPDPLEYWKSAPYLLNFVERYRLGERLEQAAEQASTALADRVRQAGVLPFDGMARFEPLAIDHARFGWLADDTVDRGAWQLLWVPPSLPYLEPSGPFADGELAGFSKRLLFSSWTMVPVAVSTLLTYEAERRMVSTGGSPRYENTPQARQNRARLLDFTRSGGRLTGMPVLGLLYPGVVLTRLGDPLQLATDRGGAPVPQHEAVDAVASRIREELDDLVASMEYSGVHVPTSGREDERWYWAAPMLLDWLHDDAYTEDVFAGRRTLYEAFTEGDTRTGGAFLDHLDQARNLAHREQWPAFDAMPDDLPEVLARMALAAPGVVATRALARVTGRQPSDVTTRLAACRIAWGWRTLFNVPEVVELVRHLHRRGPYWERSLDYGLAGNLQAVFDEYTHVLMGSRGHLEPDSDEALRDVAGVMHDTMSLRTVQYGVSRIELDGDRVWVKPETLRANFALRLSDERGDDGSRTRVSDVREAFNSPFRPFVLATTSAGQEGLDFHPYCHAIVHWNLPGNPVDLEQREGRIHRYEGHAVRRNIAADYAILGRTSPTGPWQAMVAAARDDRPPEQSDIVPHWVYVRQDGTSVERYVPALPLSRDRARADALQRAVASYRLAFGQPRQEDLLAYLANEVDAEMLERFTEGLTIDLAPDAHRQP